MRKGGRSGAGPIVDAFRCFARSVGIFLIQFYRSLAGRPCALGRSGGRAVGTAAGRLWRSGDRGAGAPAMRFWRRSIRAVGTAAGRLLAQEHSINPLRSLRHQSNANTGFARRHVACKWLVNVEKFRGSTRDCPDLCTACTRIAVVVSYPEACCCEPSATDRHTHRRVG